MGVITLKIDDKLEERLRRRVGETGAARGALSKGVEEALRQWLGGGEAEEKERVFVAMKGGKRAEEDSSLSGLAEKLRRKGIDPRDVLIESFPPPPPSVRMGLRMTTGPSKN